MENVKIDKEQGQMTALKAVEILKKHGTTITPEQAEKVLVLLKKMANIVVAQFLRQDSRRVSKRKAA